MKKIPTIFERDWDGDRSRVTAMPHPDCVWVFFGEGIATRKLDGTCCLIKDGKLYRRREIKMLKPSEETDPKGALWKAALPNDFVLADIDNTTGKAIGWMPIGLGPEDRWHRQASQTAMGGDGTYELVGPKVQGGTEKDLWGPLGEHILIAHSDHDLLMIRGDPEPITIDRSFEGLRAFLTGKDIEGIVFHHPDGRMGKIKLRDFGLTRGQQ